MSNAPPAPVKLTSIRYLTADVLRADARVSRDLANKLHTAAMASDWSAVADVRSSLAQTALVLEELAERIEG